MSKELTEQLHNGTLKEGFYYAKLPNNRVEIITDCGLDILREIKGGDKIEVLDIVPDYYQYQNICNRLSEEHRGNYNLLEENEKLKELLKECREEIGDEIDDCTDPRIELFAKIGQALGEE